MDRTPRQLDDIAQLLTGSMPGDLVGDETGGPLREGIRVAADVRA
jgi:hypothetical protein